MGSTYYLAAMLAVIVAVFGLTVPSLLTQRCPQCRTRNGLDAAACRRCGGSLGPEP